MLGDREESGLEIAVVGMAGRFPGAPDLNTFWRHLRDGVEGIARIDREVLLAAGRSASEVDDPAFVNAHGVLDGFDTFDADFFGLRGSEAEGMDPQQRIFLELCWHAMEAAGIDPQHVDGQVSVFAGASTDHYLYEQLKRNPQALERIGAFQAGYSNQPDHLAARVAYKLDLRGLAVGVQTSCSTSLVAVHLACQHLLAGGCDLALAGGVSITLPQFWGHRHEEGMIMSPDGHCRAFDVQAQGTLKGDGGGVVLLRRLADARAAGDPILAVIIGSAANNDGAAKVGYTAPGQDGQERLLEMAYAMAGVPFASIGYIEAHGTATPLGDPIEVGALTRVFRRETPARGFCGLGSVKTSIGHLDAAAGVAGLIKTVLALRHATLPASLHFQVPNPRLSLESSPFRVIDRTQAWPTGSAPRRAGVSSFGIGGNNAHVVLEEAPPAPARSAPPSTGPQLLLLSAREGGALQEAAQRLAAQLADADATAMPLADVAFTLARCRRVFAERRAVVASDAAEAVTRLHDTGRAAIVGRALAAPKLVLLFPGQGAQYPGMAAGLYDAWPVFRAELDRCCTLLQPLLGRDLLPLLLMNGESEAAADLAQTRLTQPALFAVEYALARLVTSMGLMPVATAGHSLGEWVSACLAGIFTLDEALELVVVRARAMQAMQTGAMVSVALGADAVRPLLPATLDIAADNGPDLCVVAGPEADVQAWVDGTAAREGLEPTRLLTSHAFHSAMMAPAVVSLLAALERVPSRPAASKFVSTVTGQWVEAGQVLPPAHWASNVRDAVRFGPALRTLAGLDDLVLLEVGPGNTLTSLARRHPDMPASLVTASLLRHPRDTTSPEAALLGALGRLWCGGLDIGDAWLPPPPPVRPVLPGYAFQRKRYWVDAAPLTAPSMSAGGPPAARTTMFPPSALPSGPRLYRPAWVRSPLRAGTAMSGNWSVVGPPDACVNVASGLRAAGCQVAELPAQTADAWAEAGRRLAAGGWPAQLVVLVPPGAAGAAAEGVPHLLQALLVDDAGAPLSVLLASAMMVAVNGDEPVDPDLALAAGWLQVLPAERPDTRCACIDLPALDAGAAQPLLQEAAAGLPGARVAWRSGIRWLESVLAEEGADTAGASSASDMLLPGAVYAISGGLGGMGLALAEWMARQAPVRLLLFGRTAMPDRDSWAEWTAGTSADHATLQRIRRLQAIEAAGSTVWVAQADVTDADAMRHLADEVGARWGPVRGIVHAAGVPGGGVLSRFDHGQAARVIAPKVEGTRALMGAFGAGLDWLVLCSSMTSWVPLAGRGEYTAANRWLDAYAQGQDGRGCRVLALNWDNWFSGGMLVAGGDGVGFDDGAGQAAFAAVLGRVGPQWLATPRVLRSDGIPAGSDLTAAVPAAEEAASRPSAAAAPLEPAAPADTAGQLLAAVRDLLGDPGIRADDDFFEQGGDSVVAIRLVARARRIGLTLRARDVFECRTVTRMAALADSAVTTSLPVAVASVDPVPQLTPVQHWMLGLPLAVPGHWSLGFTVALPAAWRAADVGPWLQAVVRRHDALGLHFERSTVGWQVRAGEPDVALRLERLDLTLPDSVERRQALEQDLRRPFDLAQGPLLRATVVDCHPAPPLLLGAVHHLVADLTALATLVEELGDTGCGLAAAPGGVSWAGWTQHLKQRAAHADLRDAHAWWMRLSALPTQALPLDHPDRSDTVADAAQLDCVLDAAALQPLLAAVGHGQGLVAVVLEALAATLAPSPAEGGAACGHLWVDVEGHGRDGDLVGLDVSRTVGWFTAAYPLPIPAQPGAAARLLEEMPLGRLSHGLLRHLHPDPAVRADIAGLPQPEVVFLFEGRRAPVAPESTRPVLVDVDATWARAPQDPRTHRLELRVWLEDSGLHLQWTYGSGVLERATVQAWADAVAGRLRAAAAPQTEGEGPLSFAQERLWFLHQLDDGAVVLNKQVVVELAGALDVDVLALALQDVAARHEVLRSRFVTRDGTPWQVVDPVPPARLAFADVDGPQAAERAAERAHAEAVEPFDLAGDHPLRALVLRLDAQHHWLILTVHHIATDAWSLRVVLDDLAACYSARRRGDRAVPAASSSMLTFAHWQRQWLDGTRLQALQQWWAARLQGLRPLELPTDRPRPPVQRYTGGRVDFQWPAALSDALALMARVQGATPFMALLALFKLLLLRYTGETDLAVGVPLADRAHVDNERLVGPLVNNLVMRTRLAGDQGFNQALHEVRETVLSANENGDLPFEKLVQAVRPARDRSRSPLFQVMLVFMNVPQQREAWAGLQAQPRELPAGGSEFDLTLYTFAPDAQDGLVGWFEYADALFDRASIERMAGHLRQLAEAVCRDGEQPLLQLPLMPADEWQSMVHGCNRSELSHPPVATLHALFEASARSRPDAVAAVFDDATLTYAELDARATALARQLRQRGVAPDDRVAVCTDRRSHMLVALLGTLKAGAAYVPIDPTYPADRIAYMLADSGARLVLTQREAAAHLPDSVDRLLVDVPAEQLDSAAVPQAALSPVAGPMNLAYVIYTSGSTGKPKGVQIEHAAVVNFVQAMCRRPGFGSHESLLAVTTISFDIHVLELFVPLAAGGRVVVASRRLAADGVALAERLSRGDISVMQATPATWRMLLSAGWTGTAGLRLLCGGEGFPPDLVHALMPRAAEVWNLYGPTEATVWATLERLQQAEAQTSIGLPLDNMRAYVLGPHEQPLPVGIPGELWLGGAGIARGYLDRPQLTAERFLPDPFVPGGRMYRTGDLARRRADGRLEVIGRLDHQVKLRGFRVELGEIEATLTQHEAVSECVCLVREDRPGDQRLVAYLKARGSNRVANDLLRAFAAGTLPEHMLPSAWVWLDAYPLTPNGKIDRKALPAPQRDAPQAAQLQPLTLAERFFADIFGEVLGQTGIGRFDNFFDLGGHSLLVMKVVAQAQRRGGVVLHPGELFQQTVGQLAASHGPALAPGTSASGDTPAAGGTASVSAPNAAEWIEPLFFDGTAGRLYGCLHRPLPGQPEAPYAALLCAPLGSEYLRAHRALRQLAALLARQGVTVLRFDYFGTGDADGDSEAVSLAQCEADIRAAATLLSRHTGGLPQSWIGLRLGARLALQAAATTVLAAPSAVVAWHPVTDGDALLREWRNDHRNYLAAQGFAVTVADGGAEEVLGFPLPAALVGELQALPAPLIVPQGCAVLAVHAPADADRVHRLVGGPGVEYLALTHAPLWRTDPHDVRVPSDVLARLVAWLDATSTSAREAAS